MAKQVNPEDLSAEELRRLLVEKRRSDRQARLERYRRTGRVVSFLTATRPTWALYAGQPDEDSAAARAAFRRRRVTDALLLLVEVGAVVGLIFVLFNGMNIVRELNQEVLAAIEQPTMTPTP